MTCNSRAAPRPLLRFSLLFGVVSLGLFGSLTSVTLAQEPQLRRGDANLDGELDLSDGVFVLNFLFLGREVTSCLDAADANDDGSLDLSDALRIFGVLFHGAPLLPPPASVCGPDPTVDTLDCAEYSGCAPLASAARVVLTPESSAVLVGETLQLRAQALNENDEIVNAPISFVTPSSSGLTIDADGLVTASRLGIYTVLATSGEVSSQPVLIFVDDPRGQETVGLSGRVEVPPDVQGHDLRVLSPSEEVSLGTDGTFSVMRLKWRNQILLVLDDTTDSLLWLGIAGGVIDETRAPEPIELGPRSTAEALVFLLPGLAHADPTAFADYCDVLETSAEFEELVSRLESFGSSWPGEADAIVVVMEAVVARLREGLPSPNELARLLAGQGNGAGSLPDFMPAVNPSFIGGIKVSVEQTSTPRLANLKIENTFVRQVDLYLERVLNHGRRPAKVRGPIQLGSGTGVIPSFWQLAKGVFTGDPSLPLESEKLTIPNVDFDPARGGSREWRLFAYGLGWEDRLHPDLTEDLLYARILPVAVRSIILDVACNALSILTTLDWKSFERVVVAMRVGVVAGGAYQFLVNALANEEPASDLAIAFLDFLTDLLIDVLESDAVQEALEASGRTLLKEVVEKGTLVLEFWSFASSASELVGFGHAWLNSSTVEIFRIDDQGDGRLEPKDGNLPDGFVGCPYKAEFRVIGDAGPFTWVLEGDDIPSTLELRPLGGPEFRTARLLSPGFSAVGSHSFSIRVLAPLDPHEPNDLSYVASGYYFLSVRPPSPVILDVTFPGGDGADPGGMITVDIMVGHCADPPPALAGNVSGGALSAPAPLAALGPAAGGVVTLRADLTVDKPEQDKPSDPTVEDITISVTDASGGAATAKNRIDVQNVAPSKAEGSTHSVKPGGSFVIQIEAQDDNQDGTSPEILSADVVTQHPAGLRSTPTLIDVEYRWTAVDPANGDMTFEAKAAVDVENPHPDNDGVTENPMDDAPFDANVQLSDDDGLAAVMTSPAKIVIKNVAPVIDRLTATPMVLPALGTVAARPLKIRIHVRDDNGAEDIGQVVLNLESLGFPEPQILTEPVETDADGGGATYEWSTPNVIVDCKSGCAVLAVAADKDDEASNGGVSEQASIVILEQNLAPEWSGTGILERVGPIGDGPAVGVPRCPGDLMLFAVMASDPNGDALAADLVLDGVRIPLPPSPDNPNIWKTIIPAPAPGMHEYFFEIREISVFVGGLSTSTPVAMFNVQDCTSAGDPPMCPGDFAEDEVCDGVDNNCDGGVDENLGGGCAGFSLHSGRYSVTRVPICPGDPVTYEVAVQRGDHPLPVRVEWQGPESGSRALMGDTAPDGTFTGLYRETVPAPSTPGMYTITFIVQTPEAMLELGSKLLVTACDIPIKTALVGPDGFDETFVALVLEPLEANGCTLHFNGVLCENPAPPQKLKALGQRLVKFTPAATERIFAKALQCGEGDAGYTVCAQEALQPGTYVFVVLEFEGKFPLFDEEKTYQYALPFDADDNTENDFLPPRHSPNDFFGFTDLWWQLLKFPGKPWFVSAVDVRLGFVAVETSAVFVVSGNRLYAFIPTAELDSDAAGFRATAFCHLGDFGLEGLPWSGDYYPLVTDPLMTIALEEGVVVIAE